MDISTTVLTAAIISTITVFVLAVTHIHHFGEEQPHAYVDGETVDLKVNKLTSIKTHLPIDYNDLPFCKSIGNVTKSQKQNVGEYLAGDRIRSSPYRLKMKEDMYCEQLCVSDLGRWEAFNYNPSRNYNQIPNQMVQAIRDGYKNNWIVDNIPAAMMMDYKTFGGIPLGFLAPGTMKSYIYNHVNLYIDYHDVEGVPSKARIVRFVVQPFSIRHEFDLLGEDDGESFELAKIINPIDSCNRERTDMEKAANKKYLQSRRHTQFDDVQYSKFRQPQHAGGRVLFTYDVIWRENESIDWPTRWNIYLTMDPAIPDKIRWYSIFNSLLFNLVLSGFIRAMWLRVLSRDASFYKRLRIDEEKAESILEFGWMLVHGDVFRPPSSPLILSVCCGCGSQLLCTAFWTLLLSTVGFLHPAKRGYHLMALLVLHALHGPVGGYVAAVFYNTFKGKSRRLATLLTAFGFSGIAFGVWISVYVVALWNGSTYAAPKASMIFILCLWLLVSSPLVAIGAYFGYKQTAIVFPVKTNRVPRPIPAQSLMRSFPVAIATGCIWTYGALSVELTNILGTLWLGHYYHSHGFLLLLLLIVVLTSAETAILFNYPQLSGENHYNWYWRSFITTGSAGLGLFLYSFKYLRSIDTGSSSSISSYIIYFGFMSVISLGLSLMSGLIGISACIWFNTKLFGSIGKEVPSSALDDQSPNNTPQPAESPAIEVQPANVYQDGPLDSSLIKKGAVVASLLSGLIYPALCHASYAGESYQFGSLLFVVENYKARAIVMVASIWAMVIALTVVNKRRSALPGGKIYLYNQRQVNSILLERQRKLRDILQDPFLLFNMKHRYGDLSSLLDVVQEWQTFGFQQKKSDCVRVNQKVVVPWIRNVNISLYCVAVSTFIVWYSPKLMIISIAFVHIIDNLFLHRAATIKGAPSIADKGIFAAVGIPVLEIS